MSDEWMCKGCHEALDECTCKKESQDADCRKEFEKHWYSEFPDGRFKPTESHWEIWQAAWNVCATLESKVQLTNECTVSFPLRHDLYPKEVYVLKYLNGATEVRETPFGSYGQKYVLDNCSSYYQADGKLIAVATRTSCKDKSKEGTHDCCGFDRCIDNNAPEDVEVAEAIEAIERLYDYQMEDVTTYGKGTVGEKRELQIRKYMKTLIRAAQAQRVEVVTVDDFSERMLIDLRGNEGVDKFIALQEYAKGNFKRHAKNIGKLFPHGLKIIPDNKEGE